MIGLAIDAFERRLGEDMSWMRDVRAVGGGVMRRLFGFYRFAGFRRRAPVDLLFLTRLGAIMAEDCGPCTRITVKIAKIAGVAPDLLRAGLDGGNGLPDDAAAAYRFGHAIAASDPAADELGAAIEARHGRNVRTELAIAAATARFYPAMKRGLGYARACSLTRFDDL